jgi:putative peptide zinc metalloprotease protein
MRPYESSAAKVHVLPFNRREDGPEIVIGNSRGDQFIALPREAVEVLDMLAGGATIAAAQAAYLARYQEVPDLPSFLDSLEERGFVRPAHGAGEDDTGASPEATSPRYHFTSISERWARAIFSRQALLASAVLVAAALAALAVEPSLVPGWKVLYFGRHITAAFLLLMTIGLATTFLHEMAHLVAARAAGVPCRLGISHRLWILVAETDMTGVWLLPRSRRFLPMLAGPWLDVVSASVLVLFLYAGSQGWLMSSPGCRKIMAAVLLGYFLRLLWQCFFFVRTDFYYAYATCCNCKNLMTDTKDYLRNQAARLLGRCQRHDQRHIPAGEMRAIRAYSWFWLAGRGAAFWCLLKINLPLLFAYLPRICSSLAHDWRSDRYAFVDSFAITAIQLCFTFMGFALWFKSFVTSRRTAR